MSTVGIIIIAVMLILMAINVSVLWKNGFKPDNKTKLLITIVAIFMLAAFILGCFGFN